MNINTDHRQEDNTADRCKTHRKKKQLISKKLKVELGGKRRRNPLRFHYCVLQEEEGEEEKAGGKDGGGADVGTIILLKQNGD